jgi:hypothetical protein
MDLNNTAHFVMQSKGGAGKSVCSTILAQYLKDKTAGEVSFIDTDPSNKTLGSYQALNVQMIDVIGVDKVVDQSKFDGFINDFIESNKGMLVDTGSGDFLAINNYIYNNNIPEIFNEMGKKLIIHCPINYGQASLETIKCLTMLLENYPNVSIIVWANEFFGRGEKDLADTKLVKSNKNIIGVVTIAKKNVDTDEKDFSKMLDHFMTFDEVKSTEDKSLFGFIQKTRIERTRKELYEQLDNIFGKSE